MKGFLVGIELKPDIRNREKATIKTGVLTHPMSFTIRYPFSNVLCKSAPVILMDTNTSGMAKIF